jgi:hypothetical protein
MKVVADKPSATRTAQRNSVIGKTLNSELKRETEPAMILILTQALIFGGGLAMTLFAFAVIGPQTKSDPICG